MARLVYEPYIERASPQSLMAKLRRIYLWSEIATARVRDSQ